MKSEKKINQRVYSVSDIQVMLGMKRSATYNYLTKVYKDGSPFLVHKVGSMYRVPKKSFDAWLSGKK